MEQLSGFSRARTLAARLASNSHQLTPWPLPLGTKEPRLFFFFNPAALWSFKNLGEREVGLWEGRMGLFSKSGGRPGAFAFSFLFLPPWSFLCLRMLKRKKTI